VEFTVKHEAEDHSHLEICARFSINETGLVNFEMLAKNEMVQEALEVAQRDGGIQAMVPETQEEDDDLIACAIVIKFVPTTDEMFPGALAQTLKVLVNSV
jgi:hypothetical protein